MKCKKCGVNEVDYCDYLSYCNNNILCENCFEGRLNRQFLSKLGDKLDDLFFAGGDTPNNSKDAASVIKSIHQLQESVFEVGKTLKEIQHRINEVENKIDNKGRKYGKM